MKSVMLRLFSILALTLAPLHAADDPRLPALRVADDERVAAIKAGDRKGLTAILSDDLHYAHANGIVDTKASFIDALATGRLKYVEWKYQERNFSFPASDIALMTGRTRIKVARGDTSTEAVLSFLGVWHEEKGRWRFIAWQSRKMPEPAAADK